MHVLSEKNKKSACSQTERASLSDAEVQTYDTFVLPEPSSKASVMEVHRRIMELHRDGMAVHAKIMAMHQTLLQARLGGSDRGTADERQRLLS